MINRAFGLYCRTRAASIMRRDDVQCQQRWFRTLIEQGTKTQLGRDYDFASIDSIEDYQQRVPLHTYESLAQRYYENGLPPRGGVLWHQPYGYVALSSGTTTAATKRLPLTSEMMAYHQRAAWDVMAWHCHHGGTLNMMNGLCFMLGGSTNLKKQRDFYEGDLSAIATMTSPSFLRHIIFPPRDLALLSDWEEKLERMVTAIVPQRHRVTLLTGATSWLLLLLKRVHNHCGDIPFPNLQLLIHGGMSYGMYHEHLQPLVRNLNGVRREVYPASEAFIAVQDGMAHDDLAPPLRLLSHHGVFYEFVRLQDMKVRHPPAVWLKDVTVGEEYAIVLTTAAGLWRYVIGDTVRFYEKNPPRLKITGRISWFVSAVGEHVSGEELERAVRGAMASLPQLGDIHEYSVGVSLRDDGRGHHDYVIEADTSAPQKKMCEQCAIEIDKIIQKGNSDYMDHRKGDTSLLVPRVCIVPKGFFLGWMKQRGKMGGQNKVPRVINDQKLWRHLWQSAEQASC